ncbi:MAG TPA: hypothetical protein VNI20_12230 [Fimbriimonadaceae bacterium]|nr:hypothetical protein [Fimbriimonadaceae bacterium]
MDEPQEKVVLVSKSTRNLIFGTGLVAVLIIVTSWAGSIFTENAKREALAADVQALAASLKTPMLETMAMKNATARARLKTIAVEVAKAGGYTSLVIADSRGVILATTTGKLEPKTVDLKTLSKASAKVERRDVGLWAAAPILLGGEPIGYVLVQTDR